MKKRLFLLMVCLAFFVRCSAPENCFKSSGAPTEKTVDVSQMPFTKIEVNPGIALVVSQSDAYSVQILSGENVIDDVTSEVIDGKLILKQDSGCNLTRSYNPTTIRVSCPNLEEIYSNSDQTVRSEGVLTNTILRLFSMDFFGGVGTGDFDIQVNNAQVVVEANHVAAFHIKGHTNQLLLNIYNGTGRFFGEELLAEEVVVFHRGSNDLIVHPVQVLRGDLYSTGNLISVTHPQTLEINQHYSGQLLFQD